MAQNGLLITNGRTVTLLIAVKSRESYSAMLSRLLLRPLAFARALFSDARTQD